MGRRSYPRVLVISHNVFSTTSNMGKTMASFFKGWETEKIAQLFLHSEVPNSSICKDYYRITDFDMLESILKFKKPGTILGENDIVLNKESTRIDLGIKANIYQYGRKKKPYMYLLRNMLWETKRWKTKELDIWMDSFNPQIVFYAAGSYSYSIKLAVEICKKKGIPMVVYFGDEYYFLDTHKYSFVNWINKKIFKKSFQEMFSYLNTFVAASDKMQRKYNEEFGGNGYAIMTPTDISDISSISRDNDSVKISYIGNLGLDRWKPLVEIGRCLKRSGLLVDVYSGEKRDSVLSHLNIDNGIVFHGAIPSSEVKKVINSSTIIIHVESMEEINSEKTRYSMSTKIAESLGSGVCLFAYGPKEVSSIEYLVENDAACVVTSKEELQYKLHQILNNELLREKYVNNALHLASKRHNFHINNQLFYKVITEACNRREGSVNENFTSK